VTSLILKRAKLSRSSGQWQDEDYDVLADGKVVGRIYDDGSFGTPPELRWFWSLMVTPATLGGRTAPLRRAKRRWLSFGSIVINGRKTSGCR
jgi:hypothetical protein